MRRKLLNPNSMAVIMENFRRYVNENADEETTERIYLLHEGKVRKETTLTALLEKRDRGELNMVELIDLMNESTHYELEQLRAEHDQLLLSEQEEDLTDAELHEIFGFGKKKKAAAAGSEAAPGAEGEEAAKPKQGLKYKLREKALGFMYSKVAAYIKSTYGQEKKATAPVGGNLKKGLAAAKGGKAKEAIQLLGMAGYKASLKGIKVLFKAMLAAVKMIGSLFFSLGKFLGGYWKHPLVKCLFIGFLCLMLMQAVGTTAIMYSGWKVANQVTALVTGGIDPETGKLTTGKTATSRAVGAGMGAVAKGAKAVGKKAMGLEEENLTEIEATVEFSGNVLGALGIEGVETMTWAQAMADVNPEVLGRAIIDLAVKLEGQEVLEKSASLEINYVGPDGSEIAYSGHSWDSANVALTKEMGAISQMKQALVMIQKGGDAAEGFDEIEVFKKTGEAMQQAVAAAQAACADDPAHCVGSDKLAGTVREVWSGVVKADMHDFNQAIKTVGAEAVEQTTRLVHEVGSQVGLAGVEGGAEASALQNLARTSLPAGATGIQEKIT